MAFLAAEYPALGQRAQDLTAQNLLAAQALCEGLVAAGVIQTSAEAGAHPRPADRVHHHLLASFERLVPGARRRPRPIPAWRPSTRSR